jgi:hypothetical protein
MKLYHATSSALLPCAGRRPPAQGRVSDAEGPVVLRGRIDPSLPVPVGGGGLAVFERESWRVDMTWASELIYHPEFELVLADGSARVVNGCRRQESDGVGHLLNASWTLALDDCYRLGGDRVVAYDESGHRRFVGFRPGDEVHVVGNLHGGRLHASSVFGGSPQDYAASLRNSAWPLVVGLLTSLVLVAGAVMIAYTMVRCARQQVLQGRNPLQVADVESGPNASRTLGDDRPLGEDHAQEEAPAEDVLEQAKSPLPEGKR